VRLFDKPIDHFLTAYIELSTVYMPHARLVAYARIFFAGASQVAFVLSNFGRMDQKIGPRPAMGTRLLVSISQRCDHLLFYLCY
jgi:hypothetical protein